MLGRAAADDALVSSGAAARDRRWSEVIDRLLGWSKDPSAIDDPEIEPVQPQLMRSALDLAVDLKNAGFRPPTSFGPSIDGGVSFEWRSGETLEHIEIIEEGVAEATRIAAGQAVESYQLRRIPSTRWLELSNQNRVSLP